MLVSCGPSLSCGIAARLRRAHATVRVTTKGGRRAKLALGLQDHGWLQHAVRQSAYLKQAADRQGWPVLIGSALARSRGSHVRAVFGIEDFRRKPNGNGTI